MFVFVYAVTRIEEIIKQPLTTVSFVCVCVSNLRTESLLCVLCYVFFVMCSLLCVLCYVFFVMCSLLCVLCYMFFVMCSLLCVLCYVFFVMC